VGEVGESSAEWVGEAGSGDIGARDATIRGTGNCGAISKRGPGERTRALLGERVYTERMPIGGEAIKPLELALWMGLASCN